MASSHAKAGHSNGASLLGGLGGRLLNEPMLKADMHAFVFQAVAQARDEVAKRKKRNGSRFMNNNTQAKKRR